MADMDHGPLPDPFVFEDGQRVQHPKDWPRRRAQMLRTIVDVEYGGMPPAPTGVTAEPLHTSKSKHFGDSTLTQYRVVHDDHPAFHFRLDVTVPPGEGPFPVVINGDGCWRYATDEVRRMLVQRGLIFAQFSRVEIVPDVYRPDRTTGLYLVYPEATFGALSAWAWGYHRCIDVLLTLPTVDQAKIAVVGHSRGGKTSLLAGATDQRIAVTGANGSGCGGAGCYRYAGEGAETLADTMRVIAYWFAPDLKAYVGRESDLPFDQHELKAAVAPRALLTTEALGDLWANPRGTCQTHRAAREVYRFLGCEDRIAVHYREGRHEHHPDDWRALLDFAQWQFGQIPDAPECNDAPFPDMPPAHDFTRPGA